MEAWRDAAQLCHYYCADQILQWTAVLAYSGNIPSDDNEDNSASSLQKTCDLVTYVNSYINATEKIRSKQVDYNAASVLKLLSDVEMRWWSTHTLVERVLKLKETLLAVFDVEFKHRDSPNTETALEKLHLSEDDFFSLAEILTMLTSFKDAQKALEGESYVNLSLLPLVIHNLDDQLKLCQAAADEESQGGLISAYYFYD